MHTASIDARTACQLKRGAVVYRRADNRQPERDIDSFTKARMF